MSRYYGELIGNTIIMVLGVDVDIDDTRCGPFLRVRVDINLSKPLARGRKFPVMDDDLWIPLKYEN